MALVLGIKLEKSAPLLLVNSDEEFFAWDGLIA
jgi:hypothetical protein